MLDKIPAWPIYSDSTGEKVRDLVVAGQVFDYSGRPPVTRLEDMFSVLHDGAPAVSFNSGTSALLAAFVAIGLGPGDEVIVPNFTFFATVSPLVWLGARPVLVDSAADEPSISLEAIAAAVTPRTRAVAVTHLFGYPVDIRAIAEFCSSRNLRLVEDCSHAHASRVGSQHVGTFGDVAAYSLGAGKMVTGGHGGMLVARSDHVRDLAMLAGHSKPRTRHDLHTRSLQRYAEFALGGNLRMSPVAALLALDHMERLDELSGQRVRNAGLLDAELDGCLQPIEVPHERFNGSFFDLVYTLPSTVPTSLRDVLVREIDQAGVPATAPATRPLNRILLATRTGKPGEGSPLIGRVDRWANDLPGAEDLAQSTTLHDRMISLPAGRLYSADDGLVTRVGQTVAMVVTRVLGSR